MVEKTGFCGVLKSDICLYLRPDYFRLLTCLETPPSDLQEESDKCDSKSSRSTLAYLKAARPS